MFDSFGAVLREALAAVISDSDLENLSAEPTHARLAAAIEAGDAAAAEQATRDHLDPTAAILTGPSRECYSYVAKSGYMVHNRLGPVRGACPCPGLPSVSCLP